MTHFTHHAENTNAEIFDMNYPETSDVNTTNPKLFLYQAGYLTLKGVLGDSYILGFPNGEAKKALLNMQYK